MAELKELLGKAAKQERLIGSGLMTQIMENVTALDYEHLVEAMPGVLPDLGRALEPRISEIEEAGIEKATGFVLKYLSPTMGKIVSSNEEIRDELVATEDMTFNVKAGNIAEMRVQIKEGKMSFDPGLAEEVDFFFDMSTERFLRVMSGKDNLMEELMGGGVKMWKEVGVFGEGGNMTKAMNLTPLMTIILEELKLEAMV